MDKYNLKRFISAQIDFYDTALKEIEDGKKRTHWMWFIFPQLKELGRSEMAKMYGIEDLEEARAYVREPTLRKNLITISKALLALDENDPYLVMGSPDDLKLSSSMTLFEAAAPDVLEFGMVLDKFYQGKRDEKTLSLCGKL